MSYSIILRAHILINLFHRLSLRDIKNLLTTCRSLATRIVGVNIGLRKDIPNEEILNGYKEIFSSILYEDTLRFRVSTAYDRNSKEAGKSDRIYNGIGNSQVDDQVFVKLSYDEIKIFYVNISSTLCGSCGSRGSCGSAEAAEAVEAVEVRKPWKLWKLRKPRKLPTSKVSSLCSY